MNKDEIKKQLLDSVRIKGSVEPEVITGARSSTAGTIVFGKPHNNEPSVIGYTYGGVKRCDPLYLINLSTQERYVMYYILTSTGLDNPFKLDEITIALSLQAVGISVSTYTIRKGITELIKKGIITKEKGMYLWIKE